jgi:rod shape-determining protein MreC
MASERRASSRRWLVAILIVVLIIAGFKILAAVTGRSNPVDTVLVSLTTRTVYVLRRIGQGLATITVDVFKVAHYKHENSILNRENSQLQRLREEAAEIKQENKQLHQLLDIDAPEFVPVAATVVARPFDLWLETAIINAGTSKNVAVGNLVINEKGVVGVIEKAEPTYSHVMLLVSPRCRLGVIARDCRDTGVVRGVDGETLAIDYLPTRSLIKPGEKVFTSGEQAYISGGHNRPRGAFIGTVRRRVESGGILRSVIIDPAAGASQLSTVVVMTR